MNSFKVGDRVIYPNQGLGIIEDIQEENLYGEKFNIYHVRILANNTLVLIPISNIEEIGLRKPVSEDLMEKIFEFMKTEKVDLSMNWKGRFKEHTSLMRSGTIFDMVSVLKSLFSLSLIKPLSFREKKMMEKAKDLIVAELSEVSSLSTRKIERKIENTLSLCFKHVKPNIEI